MFNIFKKKPSSPNRIVAGSLSDEDAQNIVYAFIDIMAEGNPQIGDVDDLPYQKNIIKEAFTKHIQHYEMMRQMNESLFNSKGYNEVLQNLQVMYLHVDDYHVIDPEDKESVRRLNKVKGPMPEWGLPLFGKYLQRNLQKQ